VISIKINISILVGLITIMLIVFVSGCTDFADSELSKTFSKGEISFKYPDNWFEMPYDAGEIKSDSQVLGLIGAEIWNMTL